MNLNYDPSQQSLIELLSTASPELPSHYIAVDYDGEVIIDPELHYPDIDIKRYKYCTQIRDASIRNARRIQHLHAVLMSALTIHIRPLGTSDYNIAA